MPKGFARSKRIGDQIQRELPDLIRLELKDPRVRGIVTVTAVEVSSDYSHAKVLFTAMAPHSEAAETQTGLQRAAGFLRSQLARRLKLRVVPQLHFIYDTSIERGVRLSKLIDAAVAASDAATDSDEGI